MRFTIKQGRVYGLEKTPDGVYIGKKYSPTRNTDQNGLYFALLSYAEEITGNSKDTLHEYFKVKYGPRAKRKRLSCFGTVFYKKKDLTTTTMSEKDFSKYFGECEVELAEYGVILPSRGGKEWENFLSTYS